MPSNSSESEATTRLSVKADEWWWGGAVADDQEMPFGRVAHRCNLATSAGYADNDHAGADQSARLLVSSAGRYIRLVRSTVQFSFDGEGGPELDGHDLVLGEEGTTLAPWRVLDDRHLSAVRAAVDTHQALKPDLSALFDHAAKQLNPSCGRWPTTSPAMKRCVINSCLAKRSCALRSWSQVLPPARFSWRRAAGRAATDQ